MASATRKLDQSQLMMQAGARGYQAVAGAHQFGQEERRISESRRQFDLTRWDQQWERTRAERAQRDEARAGIQAGKADTTIFGGKGRADRAAALKAEQEAAATAAERKETTETITSEAAKDRELEAAKAGLKKPTPAHLRDRPPVEGGPPGRKIHEIQGTTGRAEYATGADPRDLPGGAAPAAGGAPMDPRTAALDQEMRQDQQRGDAQMRQALESTQAGGWVSDPSSPVTQAGVAKAEASAFDMIAKRKRLGMEMARAGATLRANKTKENKIEYERTRKGNMIELANWTNALKRIDEAGLQPGQRSGSIGDWNVFRKAAQRANVPNVGNGVQILEALGTGIPNEQFMSWAVEGQGKLGLRFISFGEGLPDREYINLGSEAMQQFVAKIQDLKALARTQQGAPNGLQSAPTLEARENMLYEAAAMSILENMPVAFPGPMQSIAGGMPGAEAEVAGGAEVAAEAEEVGAVEGAEGAPPGEAAVGPQPAPGVAPEEFEGPPEATRGEQATPGRTKTTRTPSPEELGMERPRTDEEWAEYMRRLDEYPPLPEKRPKAKATEPREPEERKDIKVPERKERRPPVPKRRK